MNMFWSKPSYCSSVWCWRSLSIVHRKVRKQRPSEVVCGGKKIFQSTIFRCLTFKLDFSWAESDTGGIALLLKACGCFHLFTISCILFFFQYTVQFSRNNSEIKSKCKFGSFRKCSTFQESDFATTRDLYEWLIVLVYSAFFLFIFFFFTYIHHATCCKTEDVTSGRNATLEFPVVKKNKFIWTR